MSIVRFKHNNEFAPTSFSHLIDRFFNDNMVRSGGSAYSFVPKVDVLEDEKGFEIQLAVPGMSKEDFKIDLNEKSLTISGERKYKHEKKEQNYHSIETQYGSFSRSFSLPENVDADKIAASYTNGILEVSIPKDEKKALKATIKVS
jgi:HSP20 family protein